MAAFLIRTYTKADAFVYVCGGKVLNRKGVVEEWPGLMAQSQKTKKLGMTPEDWEKVWSVCGGNMYLQRIVLPTPYGTAAGRKVRKLIASSVFFFFFFEKLTAAFLCLVLNACRRG